MSIRSWLPLMLAFAVPAARPAFAHEQPGQTDEQFRQSCASKIDQLPINLSLDDNAGGTFQAPAVSTGSQDCSDFSWVAGSFTGGATFAPLSGFPAVTTSAWDCNHTTSEYGVYVRASGSSQWSYKGGGLLYGKLVDGVCTHTATNVPKQSGSVNSVLTSTGGATKWADYRIGLRSWAHNDTSLAHPGNLCSGENCFLPSHFKISPCGSLRPGDELKAGESRQSCDDRFRLTMQSDGNLVLYKGSSALWASNTDGSSGRIARMQADGNLVVYTTSGSAVWSTNTHGNDRAFTAVQPDGNLVVYSERGEPLWDSGTHQHAPSGWPGCGALRAGDELRTGGKRFSCDGRFELTMQSDGNLVLYQAGRAVWATGTNGQPVNVARMQSDGNFVLYDSSGNARWSTNTHGNAGAQILPQVDGNLVIYSTSSSPLWDSGTWGH